MDYNIYNYQDLINAINGAAVGSDVNLLIKNDITLNATVLIDKTLNVNFINDTGLENVTIKISSGRHFTSGYGGVIGLNVKFNKGIILDGSSTGGGIIFATEAGKIAMEDVVVCNCNQTSNGAGIIIQTYNVRTKGEFTRVKFLNNYTNLSGGAVLGYDVDVVFNDCIFENNSSRLSGGAMLFSLGSASLGSLCQIDNCQFNNNYVTANSGRGGALFIASTDGTITNSQFTENHTLYQAGAVHYSWGVVSDSGWGLSMDNCVFTKNYTGRKGGAMEFVGDALKAAEINNCQFIDNYITEVNNENWGGAYYHIDGLANFNNCQFNNNNSVTIGGAVYANIGQVNFNETTFLSNKADIDGGAIYNLAATIYIDKCVFEKNSAILLGGAIYSEDLNLIFIDNLVANTTSFIDNVANCGYYWTLGNDQLSLIHINNIKTNHFSAFVPDATITLPWSYPTAYNNFDINYNNDDKVNIHVRFYLEGTTTLLGQVNLVSALNLQALIEAIPTITIAEQQYDLSPRDQEDILLICDQLIDYYADFTYAVAIPEVIVSQSYSWLCRRLIAPTTKTQLDKGSAFTAKPLCIKGYIYIGYRINEGKLQRGYPHILAVDENINIKYFYRRIPCCCL